MERKLLLVVTVLIALVSCRKNVVEISGILENPKTGGYIFLDELKSNELVTADSMIVENDGRFEFKIKVKSPSFYLLKINQNNFLTMLLTPGEKVELTSHYDSLNYPVALHGSEGTELMTEYNKTLRRTINKLSGLSRIYDEHVDSLDLPVIIDSLDNLAQGYLNDINAYTKRYINTNIPSLVTLVALYQQVAPNVYVLDPAKDIDYFKRVDSALFRLYPEYEPVITLNGQVKELTRKVNENQVSAEISPDGKLEAPEISLPDPKGDTISLSSVRGSVVLLDFWASWCNPCRIENPNLVKAYNLYHNKGFQIFQVSLDKTKEAWIKGIEEDHLEKWIHVSDVQYWNSVVVPLYKIESIPTNFLIDKEGMIIASNLRGDALQRKLAELFK